MIENSKAGTGEVSSVWLEILNVWTSLNFFCLTKNQNPKFSGGLVHVLGYGFEVLLMYLSSSLLILHYNSDGNIIFFTPLNVSGSLSHELLFRLVLYSKPDEFIIFDTVL